MATHQADADHADPLIADLQRQEREQPDTADAGLWSVWVSAAICLAGFLWFRAEELFAGLGTDESLSVWVSSDGIGETISRAQRFQGNSPVYFSFLWVWRQILGDSEFVLRLPSVLAIVAACLVAVRFGRELGSTHMGMATAAVFLTGPGVIFATTSVRPYAFLLLFALLSSRALWHWLKEPANTAHGIVWAVTLALAVAMSPFAATLGLAHLVALIDHRVRGRSLPGRFALCVGIAAAMTLPLAPQVLSFFLNRDSFVLTDSPSVLTVIKLFVPSTALVIAMLASPGTALTGFVTNYRDTPALVRFFLAWSVLPIVTLYLAGIVAGSPVFLDRYRIVAVFGGALLVGLIVRNLELTGRHIAVIALAFYAVWSMIDIDSGRNGWRDAFAWAEDQTDVSQDRVLALNPHLIETHDFDILDDPEWTDYLGAHADAYAFDAPILIMPRTDPTPELLTSRVSDLFAHDVVVVVDVEWPQRWIKALQEAAEDRGYTATIGPVEGRVSVAVFTNGAAELAE